jgi:hypothetical protein
MSSVCSDDVENSDSEDAADGAVCVALLQTVQLQRRAVGGT